MNIRQIQRIGDRYARAGYKNGGWLACSSDVFTALAHEASEVSRFALKPGMRVGDAAADRDDDHRARLKYITACGTVEAFEALLPNGRSIFAPSELCKVGDEIYEGLYERR